MVGKIKANVGRRKGFKCLYHENAMPPSNAAMVFRDHGQAYSSQTPKSL
jgi:hypothetical protein